MRVNTLFSTTLVCVLLTLTSAKVLDTEKLVTSIENQGARRNFYKRRIVEKSPSSHNPEDDDDDEDDAKAATGSNSLQTILAPVGDVLIQIGQVLSPPKKKKKKKNNAKDKVK